MVPSVCSLEAREQIVGVYRSSPMLFKDLLVKLEELVEHFARMCEALYYFSPLYY